eukprot:scaffold16_cov242-Pinguiococcus_pyrenoidosus.AAC.17
MGAVEQHARAAAELLNLLQGRLVEGRLFPCERFQIDCALVCEMEVDIAGVLGCLSSLLVAEDQVDPVVQILAHVLALERLPVDLDEGLRAVRPGREDDIVDHLAGLGRAKLEAVAISQHLRKVEELRHELFDVTRVGGGAFPRLLDGSEKPVRLVELPVAHADVERSERLDAQQVPRHESRVAVVGAPVERRHLWRSLVIMEQRVSLTALHLGELVELVGNRLAFALLLGADRVPQIAEVLRVRQVQRGRLVVAQDPGEDRILRQVVEAAPGDHVQGHQVVKVGDLPMDPGGRQVSAAARYFRPPQQSARKIVPRPENGSRRQARRSKGAQNFHCTLFLEHVDQQASRVGEKELHRIPLQAVEALDSLEDLGLPPLLGDAIPCLLQVLGNLRVVRGGEGEHPLGVRQHAGAKGERPNDFAGHREHVAAKKRNAVEVASTVAQLLA